MLKIYRVLLLSSLLMTVAACSTSNPGDKMLTHASESEKLGKNWRQADSIVAKGNKLISTGESNVKTGQKLIKKGHAQIEDGKSLIAKGGKIQKKTEDTFQDKFPEVPLD